MFIRILVLGSALLMGCAHRAPVASDLPSAGAASEGGLIVIPKSPPIGKIASVNQASQYVIIELDLAQRPTRNQVYFVYRNRLKVGQVRITGPQEGDVTAADIVQGQIRAGDEVVAE